MGASPAVGLPISDTAARPRGANHAIIAYLLEQVPEFARLSHLREIGWKSAEGDEFFRRQRSQADRATDASKVWFFKMMQRVGAELDHATSAFTIAGGGSHGVDRDGGPRTVLDFCMAPGGFLKAVIDRNPGVRAMAFTLPTESGGHEIMLPRKTMSNINIRSIDITMLAEDMGIPIAARSIADGHPDADKFLPRHLPADLLVDLALCDGQVLRTQPRASYREATEATRLASVQLALGLEHLRPGGALVLLLHKIEAWDVVETLYTFSTFSDVQVYKPQRAHQKRSSFYMVARNVNSRSEAAKEAVQKWKLWWKTATFGTVEELRELRGPKPGEVDEVLKDYGPRLMELGLPVWKTQADALAAAPFLKK
ncbi:uncharacterized protein B0I36DRAFT_288185 [Microdochium trichocladiopsis]|uniref:Ribosomal RNA methyltransferase FtsJ domain-containing protein n=1 Tax=Microdochium trichocladiopsis TaxID=1682393 RepID=A0A9P9BQ95_9PEZI|nr:uncharacterized protein B0I36DRAFT_288185 [Microdochium trichocladiopsis]KAH7030650.1 hypothetical protein B0I36DRAFT_288185 [Microdochium trichocladiopsis]